MRTLWLLGLLSALMHPAHQDPPERGALTLILRDATGHALPQVQLLVYQDPDSGPPPLVAHAVTDAHGTVVVPNLPWGIYVVQFAGTLPDGRPIQPTQDQNARVVTDVGLAINGFAVRLAQAHLTQLFVMGTTAAQPAAAAIPMFDLANSPLEAPRPVDPQLGREITARAAAELTVPADASAGTPLPPVTTRQPPRVRWWLLGVIVLDLLLVVGWGVTLLRRRGEAQP